MTDLRKAAEMALEAMQTVIDCRPIGYETMAMTREQRLREKDQLEIDTYKALRQTQGAAEALRQALAQPPVDWEAVAADQAMTIAMMNIKAKPEEKNT